MPVTVPQPLLTRPDAWVGMPWIPLALHELGVHEVPGAGDNPRVLEYLATCTANTALLHDETAWCFDGNTEILTEDGWTAFRDYAGRQVAQVDPRTMLVSLTPVIRVIRKNYEGPLVTLERRSLALTMDPQHQLFGEWVRADRRGKGQVWADLEKHPVSDLASGQATTVSIPPIAGAAAVGGQQWSSRDLKLLAAFVADGCVHQGQLHFQVSREYKLDFLRALEPLREYKAPRAYGPRSRQALTTFAFAIPPIIDAALLPEKALDPRFVWGLSTTDARTVLDTLVFMDGSIRGDSNVILQASKARIDSFHHLSVLAGCAGNTNTPRVGGEFGSEMYGLTYCSKPRPFRIESDQTCVHHGACELFCVEVPSGLIVVRPPYGQAIVVGNCSAFVNWCMEQCGVARTHSLAARSWENYGSLCTIQNGCILVFRRRTPADPQGLHHGHVGFKVGETQYSYLVLGGNENNQVSIKPYAKTDLICGRLP